MGVSGSGTWKIDSNGTYCVPIMWGGRVLEDWCQYIFRAADKYYGFESLEDRALANPFEFSK